MSRMSERLTHLRAVSLFGALTDKELRLIAKLAEQLEVAAGEVLVRENHPGREFYIVLRGEALVSSGGKPVATLRTGDHFGELALLDPQPRSASVTMLSDGQVLEISQREFWQLLTQVPVLAQKILQTLARRLHDVSNPVAAVA